MLYFLYRDLSYNRLQWSIEDDTGAFEGLASLVSLNLAHNKIETIHGKVFHPLSSLASLDLSGNAFKTLPENPFKTMDHLSKLYMTTSNLVCDCHLSWLPRWLSQKRGLKGVEMACGFPPSFKDIPLRKLESGNFTCDVNPMATITEFPRNQTVLVGRNMTLKCVARSYTTNASITWTKDRELVEPFLLTSFEAVEEEFKVRDGESNSQGGDWSVGDKSKARPKSGNSTLPIESNGDNPVYIITSKLHVDNVTHYNSGSYQCQARNEFGPSYSPLAKITVHQFPYFKIQPKDLEVKEGGVAEIRCSASGYPVPDILLNKEGNFTAPKEKRLFYSNNVYSIKPITRGDEGVYICSARNSAGTINATAKLTVVYTPSFTRVVDNQVAVLGHSVALECQVCCEK